MTIPNTRSLDLGSHGRTWVSTILGQFDLYQFLCWLDIFLLLMIDLFLFSKCSCIVNQDLYDPSRINCNFHNSYDNILTF